MTRKILLSLMCAATLTASAQTKLTSDQLKAAKASKSYGNVSVHDPSIYYDKDQTKFYVIGSHLGMGSSSNLSAWSGINTGANHTTLLNGKAYWEAFNSCPTHEVQVKNGNTITTKTLPSFNAGDYCSIYAADRTSWISGDMWAPDVVWNPNMNKYCMYLSLNGDNWASVIVLLTSDYPDRGFKYEAPIVFGGFNNVTYGGKKVDVKNTDMSLVTGSTTLPSRFSTAGGGWGNYYPNCIDPNVFFDQNGEMWLAYGSWSGGIWMLKLDKNTGLRDYTYTYTGTTADRNATSDQYFGKKIAGGYYVSGEGPYIRYINGYYYLFMSYGFMVAGYDNNDLTKPTGGYEMRIFRSTSPTGPYKDGSGNNAIYTGYQLNYGKNSATNRGMRILGAMKGWDGFTSSGETAQGHNSAIVDKNGNAFVVYHTKFDNSKNNNYGHQMRVQQLFQNENGWLCASPFRYSRTTTTQTDIDTKRLFTAEQIAGTYKFIMHPYKLDWANWQWAEPVTVTLTADGKITGDKTGTWEFTQEGKSYVKLIISGVHYYGVSIQDYDFRYADMPSLCITATNNAGVPVWLYSHNSKAALADANDAMSAWVKGPIASDAPQYDHVIGTFAAYDYSSKAAAPEVITTDGKLIPSEEKQHISLVATMTSDLGDFYTTIGTKYNSIFTVPAVYTYPVSQQQTTTAAWNTNFSTESYTLEKDGVMHFRFYNNNDGGTANWHNWCLFGASATHGTAGATEYFAVRNDNWDNTTGSNTGCSSDFDWNTFVSDMNGSFVDMVVSYTSTGAFTMNATITTVKGKEYHYTYTKTITAKPATLTLYFVNEASHIASALLGDVNNDGHLTQKDAALITSHYLGLNPSPFLLRNADVNADGKISIADANAVLLKLIK